MGDEPQRTADGRYLVIDGRRWRASDPHIPDKLRQELVSELMSARREVRRDPDAARPRVQDAKVALGERGCPWWEQPTDEQRAERIEACVRALLNHRDGSTICPSDVARVIGGDAWRDVMEAVREVAAAMAERGEIVVLQKGEPATPPFRGPIRLGPAAGD